MSMTKKSKILITLVIVLGVILVVFIAIILNDGSTKKWCWSESKSQKTGNINESRYYDCQKEHLIFKYFVNKPANYSPVSNNFNKIYEELQESQ